MPNIEQMKAERDKLRAGGGMPGGAPGAGAPATPPGEGTEGGGGAAAGGMEVINDFLSMDPNAPDAALIASAQDAIKQALGAAGQGAGTEAPPEQPPV